MTQLSFHDCLSIELCRTATRKIYRSHADIITRIGAFVYYPPWCRATDYVAYARSAPNRFVHVNGLWIKRFAHPHYSFAQWHNYETINDGHRSWSPWGVFRLYIRFALLTKGINAQRDRKFPSKPLTSFKRPSTATCRLQPLLFTKLNIPLTPTKVQLTSYRLDRHYQFVLSWRLHPAMAPPCDGVTISNIPIRKSWLTVLLLATIHSFVNLCPYSCSPSAPPPYSSFPSLTKPIVSFYSFVRRWL